MDRLSLPYGEYWFPFEEYDKVDDVIRIMHELKIPELRTCFSWADWERPGGPEWFDGYISKLHAAGIRLMPCLFYTPLEKAKHVPSMDPTTAFPPERLEDFADFTQTMLERYGHTFEWIHMWNEPNWQVYWNQQIDPDGKLFAQMVGPAMDLAHAAQKKVVLGGLSPYDPAWVRRMQEYGVLEKADVVGIHAFPGTWDEGMERRTSRPWVSLAAEIADLRVQLRELGSSAQAWYTETGFSTWYEGESSEGREVKQIAFFDELIRCGADRVFWHTLIDQEPHTLTDNVINEGLSHDRRAYHFGLVDIHGRKKPVFDHWKALIDNP